MNKLLLITALLVVFTACETKVDLDVAEGPKNIIVDGGITDKIGPDTIYLSQTQDYNSKEGISYITGATLIVTENGTVEDALVEISPGTYITQTIGKGTIGATYQLYIKTPEGVEYESLIETMQQVPAIDSLYFRKTDELEDLEVILGEDEDDALFFGEYVGLVAIQDPPETRNYLRHKIWLNHQYQKGTGDIALYDDQYTNGQYLKDVDQTIDLFVDDTLKVEQIALTEGAYRYLEDFIRTVTAGGGPFDPAPAPLIGNIFKKGSTTEYGLGYFHASSSVSVEEIVEQR